MERTITLREYVTAGLVAGIAGGALLVAFLSAVQLAHGLPPSQLAANNFTFLAAMVLGDAAYLNPAAVPIGIGVHFGVAVAWALGYAYAARSQPPLLARPWVSGAAFGLVVYIFMQIILLYAGLYHRPMPDVLGAQLVAYIVFYGMPVGLIVARAFRRSAASAPG